VQSIKSTLKPNDTLGGMNKAQKRAPGFLAFLNNNTLV
jgi:hypothetical protein